MITLIYVNKFLEYISRHAHYRCHYYWATYRESNLDGGWFDFDLITHHLKMLIMMLYEEIKTYK